MGRKGQKKKHKPQVKSKGGADSRGKTSQENNGKGKEKYTVEQLLAKVEEYMDSFEFELAQKFAQRALEQDADHPGALETCGVLLMEMGEHDKAKHCFGRAIEVLPDEGHSKYMYMAQMMTSQDSVQYFYKGIEIMKKNLQQSEGASGAEAESDISIRDVSSAYCSIAELFLTDLCDQEDAEEQCQQCLQNAIQADNTNPEAYHLSASFWLSKEDKTQARDNIEKGISLWLPQWKEADKPEGAELDPVNVCEISYPARMNSAKILIEVENYDVAAEILELLLDEEDEVVEVWYMLGWLNYLQKEDYKDNARYYLNKAKEVAVKTKFDDSQMLDHVEKLLTELGPVETQGDGEEEGKEIDENYETDEDEEGMEVEDG